MKRNSIAIVGASETTELGKVPGMSQVQLHADAALLAWWRASPDRLMCEPWRTHVMCV